MKDTIGYQKEVANKVLRVLHQYFDRSAILAGGAPRNWDHDLPANDLDIYLRHSLGSNFLRVFETLWNTCYNDIETDVTGTTLDFSKPRKHSEEEYKGANIDIVRIDNLNIGGITVQFMCVNEKPVCYFEELITNSFDVGICKISYNEYRGILKDSAYISDVVNKTITVFTKGLSDYQLKHCLTKHVPKMQDYYPDHRLTFEV